jgi:exonuclease VII small subunit
MASARPLSEALAKMARQELNETPERVEQDLATIRDWLDQTPHLNARTDDQFLVPFIRSCKFQLDQVKERLENYYSAHTSMPGFNVNQDPRDELMEMLLKTG